MVLTIDAFPDAEAVVDAHRDSSKLAHLTANDLRSDPGCEVYWRFQDDPFVGQTREGACRVESSRSGRTLIISDDLYLDADEIWIQDRAVDTEGNHVYGHRGGIPHKLERVRWFDCWAAAPKDVEAEDWHLWRPIRLHDQGGRYEMVAEGADTFTHAVELFQAVHARTGVPVLEMAIHRQDQPKRSAAHAWGAPDASRIGIDLRTVQVGCTLAEPHAEP